MLEQGNAAVAEGARNAVRVDEPPVLEPLVRSEVRHEIEEAVVLERQKRQLLLSVDCGKNSCRRGAEASAGRVEHDGSQELGHAANSSAAIK